MSKEVKRVTLKDIAEACNISLSTVSRVLNNSVLVGDENREVILDVADIVEYKGTILSAMTAGMTRTVEVETDPKNGETTPGA